jgi:hypothetical protein
MKLGKAIEAVRDAEAALAKQLHAVGERHSAEQDLYHLGHTLAGGCVDRVTRLQPFADRYHTKVELEPVADSSGILTTVRRTGGRLLARSDAAGLQLMRDLRELYLSAQAAEISWTVLIQATRAARDRELLDVANECHDEAEQCGKWVRTRIKESAPQVYATG